MLVLTTLIINTVQEKCMQLKRVFRDDLTEELEHSSLYWYVLKH